MTSSYATLQANLSRGSMIFVALMLIALVSLVACSGDSDVHGDAATAGSQKFINAYYQHNSAKDGLEFCTGDAKVKVEKEVEAIEKSGVSPDLASQKPTVTVKLDGYKKLNDQQYRVTWNVHSSTGQSIKVATTMVRSNDRWLVRKFVENEK